MSEPTVEERSVPINEVIMTKFMSREVSLFLTVCIVVLSIITSVYGGNKYTTSLLVSSTILIIPFCIMFVIGFSMATIMALSSPGE
jgi:ABC-type polysaccharide/polyol phosphate export permease